jgi:hypothetical protein
MIVGAVVGGQGDDWIRQESLPLEKLNRLLGTGVGRHPIVMTLTEDGAGCKESGGRRCKSANGRVWEGAATKTVCLAEMGSSVLDPCRAPLRVGFCVDRKP